MQADQCSLTLIKLEKLHFFKSLLTLHGSNRTRVVREICILEKAKTKIYTKESRSITLTLYNLQGKAWVQERASKSNLKWQRQLCLATAPKISWHYKATACILKKKMTLRGHKTDLFQHQTGSKSIYPTQDVIRSSARSTRESSSRSSLQTQQRTMIWEGAELHHIYKRSNK